MEKLQEFSTIREEMTKKVSLMQNKFKSILEGADSLDLVICMDLTGSMSSWISQAKTCLFNG
jgi:hypothetical protein